MATLTGIVRSRGCVAFAACVVFLAARPAQAGEGLYSYTNIGAPEGAYSVVGVRMNNLGHVAGWSQYFGQGEPSLKGWVWTSEDGFTILPPPPGFFEGRSRAMDINDNGVVGGDGGFDTGLSWRYENGVYEVTGSAEGMPAAYLGGINNAGDLAGTAKDGSIVTPDFAWIDLNGAGLTTVTPSGGRATDLNNVGEVCGYAAPVSGPFQAYRWDASGGVQFLGSLGLAFSFAHRINDNGDVIGTARSASGNTNRAWIYTDELGMVELPAPYQNASTTVSINNSGHVVGISEQSGPDFNWLWTGEPSVTNLTALFDVVAANVNVITVRDINDAGQILVQVYDNNVADFRMFILTPPGSTVTGDLDGDDQVGITDMLMLLADWGPCDVPCPPSCAADLDGDCTVGILDFLELLANWSP